MYTINLKSIKRVITYKDAIEKEDISDIYLPDLSDFDLDLLYQESVGCAEVLLEFEIESRSNN